MGQAYAETATTNTEENTEKSGHLISPYGDNPNLFHVFMYKAQNQVIKAGQATGRGLAKVGDALDNTFGANDRQLPEKPEFVNHSLSQPANSYDAPAAISSNQQSNAAPNTDTVNT